MYIYILIGMLSVMLLFGSMSVCGILRRGSKTDVSEMVSLRMKYQLVLENYEKQRKKTHEYKNQLLCIDSLLINKKYDELRKYLDNICGEMDEGCEYINTNNVIANTIINTKYSEAIKNGILFVIKSNDLSDIRISDADIVLILSNLLDNAIEACKKCKENKVIKMKFEKEEDIIVISVKNTYVGKFQMKGSAYLTSKEDKENHGIGIKNIIETIEKYHGEYAVKSDDNEFQFSIIIPLKDS